MIPTLQEIAAMPLPASRAAVRRYYDPLWGKIPDPDGPERPFKVEIEWEKKEEGTFATTITAGSQGEAEMLAEEEFRRRCGYDHEIMASLTKEILQ
jgi:hypothetical protein